MLVKNMMEDTQLNFNQPLLSVRRSSSTVASGKDEKKKTDNSIPNIPRLPSYKSELKSGPIRNAGTVPFVWEQSPGRPKGESKPRTFAIERPPIAPKLPPGRILKAPRQDIDKDSENSSVTKHPGKTRVQSSDENVTKTESSKHLRKEESSDSGDGDEEYLDALDSLSLTDSFFLNCSVSGVSGLDGPDLKPFGTFSADPQSRDFMMGRFLPAAKAMASETPQHAPRKQPVTWEKPREVKKVVSGGNRPPLRYGPNVIPHYAQESTEEESEDEYEEHGRLSANICGLLPRFCLKGSVGLLHPVPGMSVRTRVPSSHTSRTQASSSSAGSFSETVKELTMVANYEQQSVGGLRKTVLHEDTGSLKNESDKINSQGSSHKLEGSTLYRRLQGSGTSPSHKEGPHSFQELLADRSSNGEAETGSPMVEKTLYVDTIHKVESPERNPCPPDMKGLPKLRENDFKFLAKNKGTEETLSVDSSFKDFENLSIADEGATIQPKVQHTVDFTLPSTAEKSNWELGANTMKDRGQDQDFYPDFATLENSKLPANVNLDFEVHQPQEAENLEISHRSLSEFPAPPPLPKSPSDSWLWRTLPSISSRNPTSRSYTGTRNNPRNWASNTSSNGPKCEAIVNNNTKGQNQHLQFSEELLVPIPET